MLETIHLISLAMFRNTVKVVEPFNLVFFLYTFMEDF